MFNVIFSDSLSEFNKIPSTVSGLDTAEGAGRSVFYVDGDDEPQKPRVPWPHINTANLEKGISSS